MLPPLQTRALNLMLDSSLDGLGTDDMVAVSSSPADTVIRMGWGICVVLPDPVAAMHIATPLGPDPATPQFEQ